MKYFILIQSFGLLQNITNLDTLLRFEGSTRKSEECTGCRFCNLNLVALPLSDVTIGQCSLFFAFEIILDNRIFLHRLLLPTVTWFAL